MVHGQILLLIYKAHGVLKWLELTDKMRHVTSCLTCVVGNIWIIVLVKTKSFYFEKC